MRWSPTRKDNTFAISNRKISRFGKTIRSRRSPASRSKPIPNRPITIRSIIWCFCSITPRWSFSDQTRARQAATKFIDANAGPNRFMAIINYAGSIGVAQNFTADADRLKKVVGRHQVFVQFRPIQRRTWRRTAQACRPALPNLGRAQGSFGSVGRIAGAAQHGQASGAHTGPQDGRVSDLRLCGAPRPNVGVDRCDCRVQSRECGDLPYRCARSGTGIPAGPAARVCGRRRAPKACSLIPASYSPGSFHGHGVLSTRRRRWRRPGGGGGGGGRRTVRRR